MVLLCVCLLQERDEVSSSLPCSILGPGQDVSPHAMGQLIALFYEQLPLETVVFKFICDVLKKERKSDKVCVKIKSGLQLVQEDCKLV